MKLKPCPECESEFITVNSSREMRISEMICDDCGYTIQEKINEDALIKKWNKLKRNNF